MCYDKIVEVLKSNSKVRATRKAWLKTPRKKEVMYIGGTAWDDITIDSFPIDFTIFLKTKDDKIVLGYNPDMEDKIATDWIVI